MENGYFHPRGIVIAALRGGSGKTILSIGISAAWRKKEKTVIPFKKGPDYIDAGWLALAAGRACYNLDSFLCTRQQILSSFYSRFSKNSISVIEGNRGLYDGIDIDGETSTAEIAKLIKFPVILCIDCTKTTRTMAAVVSGCIGFDPDVGIKGVVLNRVAGPRHEDICRKSIEHHCGIPVLGAVPKLKKQQFPERHMGLVPTHEHQWAIDSINTAAKIAEEYIDLDGLEKIANQSALESNSNYSETVISKPQQSNKQKPVLRIGIFKDSAFQFYYPENIEALISLGAEIVYMSPLSDKEIPPVDALYIGGGFPETHAKELSENINFRNCLKELVEDGLPVYAECGGLMYLGKELVLKKKYPMTGVFPIVFGISKKPQGHGYTVSVVDKENPYFKIGTELKGHEFRYSKILEWDGTDNDLVFSTKRGKGFVNNRDGICYKNVLAGYTHLHALGTPQWADAMARNAMAYKLKNS